VGLILKNPVFIAVCDVHKYKTVIFLYLHKFENNNYYETYVTKLSTFHVDYTQIRFFINFFIFCPLFSFIL